MKTSHLPENNVRYTKRLHGAVLEVEGWCSATFKIYASGDERIMASQKGQTAKFCPS